MSHRPGFLRGHLAHHGCQQAQGIRTATVEQSARFDFIRYHLSFVGDDPRGKAQCLTRKQKLDIIREHIPVFKHGVTFFAEPSKNAA